MKLWVLACLLFACDRPGPSSGPSSDLSSGLPPEAEMLERTEPVMEYSFTPVGKDRLRGYVYLGVCSAGKWINSASWVGRPDCSEPLPEHPVAMRPHKMPYFYRRPGFGRVLLGVVRYGSPVLLLGYESELVGTDSVIWWCEIEVLAKNIEQVWP